VIGKDREKDVAVLKLLDVPKQKLALLKPVELGSSSDLLVGQKVGVAVRGAASGVGAWVDPYLPALTNPHPH